MDVVEVAGESKSPEAEEEGVLERFELEKKKDLPRA